MKNLILFIIFFQIQFLYSQRDPLDPVFTVDQPIWSHVAMDSSAIGQKPRTGNYPGRTGMDFFVTLSESKILLDPQNPHYAYLVYDNFFNTYSGSFIEKLDLRNGKSLWNNYFDLRNNDYREQTNRYFINTDGELELLGIKHDQDTFAFVWYNGKFTCRKYDTATGELKYYWSAPRTDENYPSLFQNRVLNRIVKNDKKQYDFYTIGGGTNGFKRRKLQMDEFGKLISMDSIEIKSKYNASYQHTFVIHLPEDSGYEFAHLDHTVPNSNFTTGDSLSLVFYRFGDQLQTIVEHDLSDQVKRVREFGIHRYINNHAVVYTRDFDTTFREFREGILLLNNEGKLVEEVIFKGPRTDPFGRFATGIKLKDDPGMLVLIVTSRDTSSNRDRIYFYKTDGKGNMSFLKEVRITPGYIPFVSYLKEMDNGDILWNLRFSLRDGPVYQDDRMITSRWSKESLGLSSTTNAGIAYNFKVYPNPVKNEINLSHALYPIHRVELYGMEGIFCKKQNFLPSNDVMLSITDIPVGMYIIQAYGADDKLLYAGKFIKPE